MGISKTVTATCDAPHCGARHETDEWFMHRGTEEVVRAGWLVHTNKGKREVLCPYHWKLHFPLKPEY